MDRVILQVDTLFFMFVTLPFQLQGSPDNNLYSNLSTVWKEQCLIYPISFSSGVFRCFSVNLYFNICNLATSAIIVKFLIKTHPKLIKSWIVVIIPSFYICQLFQLHSIGKTNRIDKIPTNWSIFPWLV